MLRNGVWWGRGGAGSRKLALGVVSINPAKVETQGLWTALPPLSQKAFEVNIAFQAFCSFCGSVLALPLTSGHVPKPQFLPLPQHTQNLPKAITFTKSSKPKETCQEK